MNKIGLLERAIGLTVATIALLVADLIVPSYASADWGSAYTEGSDQVRTEITANTTGQMTRKRNSSREYWIRTRGTCLEAPGSLHLVGEMSPDSMQLLAGPDTTALALYRHVRQEPDGRLTSLGVECRPFPRPKVGNAAEQKSRDPLTARVEEWLQVPAPVIGVSPRGTEERPGLTGLETAFWVEGATVWAPPPTTLGGTQVEVQAWPAEYQWDTGDGSPPPGSAGPSEHAYVSLCPGSEQGPSAATCGGTAAQPQVVHVYETKSSVGSPASGAYTVKVVTVWHARYRVLRPTGAGPWIPLPERQTESSQPYRVQEVRSALVP